jgi:hypothetical protein
MAGANIQVLNARFRDVQTKNQGVEDLLAKLAADAGVGSGRIAPTSSRLRQL